VCAAAIRVFIPTHMCREARTAASKDPGLPSANQGCTAAGVRITSTEGCKPSTGLPSRAEADDSAGTRCVLQARSIGSSVKAYRRSQQRFDSVARGLQAISAVAQPLSANLLIKLDTPTLGGLRPPGCLVKVPHGARNSSSSSASAC
jgi:hypothetical protein